LALLISTCTRYKFTHPLVFSGGVLINFQNDLDYLNSVWDRYNLALNFSLSFIDESGLMNVTSPNDWLRFGMGGHNIEVRYIRKGSFKG
jgi:hypothetical protein